MKRVITAFCILVISTAISAQEQQTNQENKFDNAPIAEEFNSTSELPDGVAYRSTLALLSSSEPDLAIRMIQNGMRVERATAEDFYGILAAERSSLVKDIDRANRALGCVGESPALQREAATLFFQSMYDVAEREASRRYEALRRSTDPELFSKFSQWLEERKLHTVHVRFDMKEMYSRSGMDAGQNLASFCSNPMPEPNETNERN